MSDSTSSTEPLEIPPESPFPAMLLLKKKPPMMDAAARSAELANFQKTGSSLLGRVKDFLPQMEQSQTALQQRIISTANPDELDIEHVEEGSTAVEFNLALFEQDSSDSDDSSSESSDSDSNSSLQEGKLKLRPKTHPTVPKISVCEEDESPSSSIFNQPQNESSKFP